jgi:hypothetical protein
MSNLDSARDTVERLAAGATDPEAVEKAARAAAALYEIGKLKADTQKALNEAAKIENELSEARQRNKSDERKHYASLLAPLLSTLILGGTLVLQTYQAFLSDRQKQVELDRQRTDQERQRDAAEDALWGETLKALSQEYKEISPGLVNLRRFLSSSRYAELSKKTAEQALFQTTKPDTFKELFFMVYGLLDWRTYPKTMDLARAITIQYVTLNEKLTKSSLTDDEETRRSKLYDNMTFICSEVSRLLKGPRPSGVQIEFRSIYWFDCDFSNVDLRGAEVAGFQSARMNFKGADLSNLSTYQQSIWGFSGSPEKGTNVGTAWWQASKLSPEALKYLNEKFPYNKDWDYGTAVTSEDDYHQAIMRLSN